MTFMDLLERFPTENDCIDYYITIRYGNTVHCNHCGSSKTYQRKKKHKVFNCNDCNNTFSPFKGTVFEKSSTDMRKWYYAIHLFLNSKKGISALQLQREIGVTYKCAWRMLQQIRISMGNVENQEFFNTIIEMDETYVGGKPRKDNDHHDGSNNSQGSTGRGTKKTPVVGVIDRMNKTIYAKVAMPNEEGRQLTANNYLLS